LNIGLARYIQEALLGSDNKQDFMKDEDQETILCPAGREDCPLAVDLARLREECRRLTESLEVDSLTGLYNYRHFLKAMDEEMERTRRTGLPTALIMIDLDHFKQINDRFGHEAGNKALRAAGSVWRENTRRIDIACRFGGEEFAIILPGTKLYRAIRAAERLRDVLEKSPVEFDGEYIRVTASFGVDVFETHSRCSTMDFIKSVDGLLLQAKSEGRNRVCHRRPAADTESAALTAEERKALFDR
jgi:two-component system cell cycle response regulator